MLTAQARWGEVIERARRWSSQAQPLRARSLSRSTILPVIDIKTFLSPALRGGPRGISFALRGRKPLAEGFPSRAMYPTVSFDAHTYSSSDYSWVPAPSTSVAGGRSNGSGKLESASSSQPTLRVVIAEPFRIAPPVCDDRGVGDMQQDNTKVPWALCTISLLPPQPPGAGLPQAASRAGCPALHKSAAHPPQSLQQRQL